MRATSGTISPQSRRILYENVMVRLQEMYRQVLQDTIPTAIGIRTIYVATRALVLMILKSASGEIHHTTAMWALSREMVQSSSDGMIWGPIHRVRATHRTGSSIAMCLLNASFAKDVMAARDAHCRSGSIKAYWATKCLQHSFSSHYSCYCVLFRFVPTIPMG